MLDFPKHAKVSKIIAKENFYGDIDNRTKKLFQEHIARIIWEYKLAPRTINLSAKKWPEIEVFRIILKDAELPQKVLKTIDTAIPYPILFIIEKGTITKVAICYKEPSKKNDNFTQVDTYFETDWNDSKLEDVKIDGLDLDTVYENFIRQIAGGKLKSTIETNDDSNQTSSVKEDLEKKKEHDKIQKQIDMLERRKQREPSIGKKQEIAKEIFLLRKNV